MPDHATDVAKRATVPLMKPAKEKKAIVTRMRQNGLNGRSEKGAAKAKEKEKGKEKVKLKAAGIGKGTMRSYRAPIIIRVMDTASLATTAASPMKERKGVSENTRPWLSKALPRNKRRQ
jgi:prophage tail gpP-like protein